VVNLAILANAFGSGRYALARIALAAAALCLPTGLAAQQPPSSAVPLSSVPVPGDLELAKLIWSTMAAVDHANQAGNYSVLRDLAAPGFQVNNDSARLAEIFRSLRSSRIDLSNTLLLAPTYNSAPRMVEPDVMQVRGGFGLRPTAIGFDLYYQWNAGRWKLFGVSIVPLAITTQQPVPAAQTPPPPPAKRN
jgi:hypothetical protein